MVNKYKIVRAGGLKSSIYDIKAEDVERKAKRKGADEMREYCKEVIAEFADQKHQIMLSPIIDKITLDI